MVTTTEYRIPLRPPLGGQHVAELERRIYFLDPSIVDFRLEATGGMVNRVVLVTNRPADPALLRRRLDFVVANDVRSQLPSAPKVLWRSPHTRPVIADPFADLVAAGLVTEAGTGRVTLGGSALVVLDAVDRVLRDLAVTVFGAREYRYPTLIALDALRRSTYLAAFPQYLMFVTRPRGDVDTYRAVAAAATDPAADLLAHCGEVTVALPPTMCYHTFDQFAGARLTGSGTAVTARGASFRHESRYHRGLERLADFTIRETVFLGPAAFVRRSRDTFLDQAERLVTRLGLAGHCEVASDPFFCDAGSAARISAQRLLELKHELHLEVGSGRSIAVGSFNLHDRHFGAAFDIHDADGAPVATSCVGFGLERLTYALFCQHGRDVAEWPAPVRETLARPSTNGAETSDGN